MQTIPKRFVTNVGGQIPEEVQLEVPNGKTYNIKIAREHDALVMGSGWANFASAYDLKQGDFLVFTYSGKSHFKVRMFDPSNCEKYFSCVVMDNTPTSFHMQSPTSKRSVEHCHTSSSHMRKTSKKKRTDSPSQKYAEDVNNKEPFNSVVFQKSWLVFPTGCNITSEQKRKIDALEQKIRPQIPLYITAMDMTSVSFGFLAISKDYVFKHLLDKNGTITISHPDGSKTWAITLGISTVGWYAHSTGWLDFIEDNRLREGHICIFEPSKSKGRVTLIFHPLEICSKKAPGFVPSSRSPMHGVSEPGYIVPRFTVLNDQQKHKVEDKVRAIGSPYHIFVLIAQTSNIIGKSCSMAFCSAYAKKYLQRGSDTMSLLHPQNSKKWEAEIEINNNRHKLGQGWRQFVSDNKLKVGDICLFQLMETKKLTMIVHIIPKQECT
ncbi:unnamed protein product [Urochloa decumbens]|uniref:TF-B3 domain-containing protein n=1 Tax=Urochloa decumbens TaxID=240449 RepID=A0ABC9ARM7_9POAL